MSNNETVFQIKISFAIDITNPVIEEEVLKAIGENAIEAAKGIVESIKNNKEIQRFSVLDKD